MSVLTAGFNPAGAVSGAGLSTSDPGDLTALDTVSLSVGFPQYQTTPAPLAWMPPLAMEMSGGSNGIAVWGTGKYSASEDYGRFYVYWSQIPSATVCLVQTEVADGFALRVNSTGHLILGKAGGGTVATMATAMSTGQWYRVEYHIKVGANTHSIDLYTNPDGATSAEQITGAWTLASPAAYAFGGTENGSTEIVDLAKLVAMGTTPIGPFPVSTTAPVVSGSALVGSLLSCSTGVWNGGATFALSYQWTRNAVDIGGATLSNYTAQPADIGAAVGCKTTATGLQATNESATQASSNTINVVAASSSIPGPAPLVGRMGR